MQTAHMYTPLEQGNRARTHPHKLGRFGYTIKSQRARARTHTHTPFFWDLFGSLGLAAWPTNPWGFRWLMYPTILSLSTGFGLCLDFVPPVARAETLRLTLGWDALLGAFELAAVLLAGLLFAFVPPSTETEVKTLLLILRTRSAASYPTSRMERAI